MQRIAVFAALRWECQPVLRHLRQVRRRRVGQFHVWCGAAADAETWLVKTGAGMRRAGAAAAAVTAVSDFDLFLSTGCAGALVSDLIPGDAVVAASVVGDLSGDRFETDTEHRERAWSSAQQARLRVSRGTVLSSPRALLSVADKREAAARTGAIAVEMEGAAIAAGCGAAQIPFASVRTILDPFETELVAVAKFLDLQSGRLKPLALAGGVARNPDLLPKLFALQRMVKAAQNALDRFFAAFLAAPAGS